MAQKALTGVVDDRDQTIAELREQIRELTESALEIEHDLEQANSMLLGIANLRNQLAPLYRALQDVFGEIDKIDISHVHVAASPSRSSSPSNAAVDERVARVWEEWKKKLGGTAARVIDAMLIHGEMTVPQIRVAAQCGNQTVYDTTSKMNKLGLINKNGGKYSLKQL